jgi:hypothetical protein
MQLESLPGLMAFAIVAQERSFSRGVAATNAGKALPERLLPALRNVELAQEKLAEDTDRPRAFVRINTHRTAPLLHLLLKSSLRSRS